MNTPLKPATIRLQDSETNGIDSAVAAACSVLKKGGLIIYPTDTAYGIGGDATSEAVVKKIHEAKGIADKRPMSVMVADFAMVDKYCETGLWEDIILKRYLPGPYTLILKRSKQTIAATNSDRLGVRIPDNEFCQKLCAAFGKPIITTSANTTGNPAPMNFDSVDKRILETVDLAIDGGQTKYGKASTVVDLVERKRVRGENRIDM